MNYRQTGILRFTLQLSPLCMLTPWFSGQQYPQWVFSAICPWVLRYLSCLILIVSGKVHTSGYESTRWWETSTFWKALILFRRSSQIETNLGRNFLSQLSIGTGWEMVSWFWSFWVTGIGEKWTQSRKGMSYNMQPNGRTRIITYNKCNLQHTL